MHMDLSQDRDPRVSAAQELVRWILTECRPQATGQNSPHDAGSPVRFINALCRQLASVGVPLWRVTIFAATLHPQLRGFRDVEEVFGLGKEGDQRST
jgi:hypothetical protein